MTRPSFLTNIGGTWFRNRDGVKSNGFTPDAKYAKETVSGVSRRRPQGWVPPTPYHFDRERRDRCIGSFDRTTIDTNGNILLAQDTITGVIDNSDTGFSALDLFNQVRLDSVSPPDSFVDRALIKARLQMKSSDVNLAVAFAERDATARMLGDNARTIARAFNALRRKDFPRLMRELKLWEKNPKKWEWQTRKMTTIERWLELQYGWKPLLSDVYGACDALEKAPTSSWMITGKGSYRETVDAHRPPSLGDQLWRYDGVMKGEQAAFVRIDAQPGNTLIGTLSSLGITNPALVAWELVPFSFVVDWALPVGSWLDSLDAMLGYGDTWCSVSTLTRGRWDIKGESFVRTFGSIQETTTNHWSAWKETVHLHRTVSTSVPLPTLPRFKDPRSLAHMANGLSLLAQAFSRV